MVTFSTLILIENKFINTIEVILKNNLESYKTVLVGS